MSHHTYNEFVTPAQRGWLRLQNDALLHDLMSECDAEPADFENCLACAAYGIAQELEESRKMKTYEVPHTDLAHLLRIAWSDEIPGAEERATVSRIKKMLETTP